MTQEPNTHSYFWRHVDQLTALRGFLERFRNGPEIAVWCAGCAQGEEAYSLAFLLEEMRLDGRIIGTDILPEALDRAKSGVYREGRLRQLPSAFRRRFRTVPSGFKVPENILEMVEFRNDDLRQSRLTGPFEVVLCRNVLIYFDGDTQASVLERLGRALKAGGLLVLGYSESSLLELPGFRRLDEHAIFEKLDGVLEGEGPPLPPEICLLSEALGSYAQGHSKETGALFEAVLKERPDSLTTHYFKALYDLDNRRRESALRTLRWLADPERVFDAESDQFLDGHGVSRERFLLTIRRLIERLQE